MVAEAAGVGMDAVTFTYPEGGAVLSDVALDVPAGRTIAVVGPTGSGKVHGRAPARTTLGPEATATVRLDGRDLRETRGRRGAAGDRVRVAGSVPCSTAASLRTSRSAIRGSARPRCSTRSSSPARRTSSRPLPEGIGDAGRGARCSAVGRTTPTRRARPGPPRDGPRPPWCSTTATPRAVDPSVEAGIMSRLRSARTCRRPSSSWPTGAARSCSPTRSCSSRMGVSSRNGRHEDLLASVPGYATLLQALRGRTVPDAAQRRTRPRDAGRRSDAPADGTGGASA